MRGQKPQQLQKKPAPPAHEEHEDGEEGEEGEDEDRVPGGYNPNDYNNLNATQEVKDLFKYIGRYRPQILELGSTIKPFIPDYIPAIGEVDAFLKPGRPDKTSEILGLSTVVRES
jgi:intraflagellar transport protein 46